MKARIVIQMAKYDEIANVLSGDDILVAKFMIKLLNALLRVVSVQCLGFFQSKTYLWPFHLIISARALSCFHFFSVTEEEEGSMELNNTGLQLRIQYSGN